MKVIVEGTVRAPKLVLFLLPLLPAISSAWHHPVHYMITRAAIDSLSAGDRRAFGDEIAPLIERYSVYPDLYGYLKDEERDRLRPFCFLPDGRAIHNVNWNQAGDLEMLTHLIASIAKMLDGRDVPAAAQYAGVLSHFLADSTCPAHAMIPADSGLRMTFRPPPGKSHVELHAVLERSSPPVDVSGRKPRMAGATAASAAESLLARCYAAIRRNRETLEEAVRAAYLGDEAGMNPARLRAAEAGAGLIADAFHTAVHLAK
jgi:hypothetical protein